MNFISLFIIYNNLPLIQHLITSVDQITQNMIYTAMNSYNLLVLDYLLSFHPNIDITTGVNYMYGKVISPLYDKSKDKQQVDDMIDYLMTHQLYGDDDKFIKYLIKTQNIKLLNEFKPPRKYEFIIYAKNYPLSYKWFTQ